MRKYISTKLSDCVSEFKRSHGGKMPSAILLGRTEVKEFNEYCKLLFGVEYREDMNIFVDGWLKIKSDDVYSSVRAVGKPSLSLLQRACEFIKAIVR